MALKMALLVMVLAAPFMFANAQTTVTWALGKDYTSYATQSLKAGGTIVFNYDTPTHDVLVVSKSDYDSCNAANPLQSFTDGKSTITLKQGAMYFICGTPGHCSQGGMKLQVNVGDSGSSSTPTTPTSPATPSTPTPDASGSTTPPAAPAPKDSSGTSARLSGAGFLVLGAFFGFIC